MGGCSATSIEKKKLRFIFQEKVKKEKSRKNSCIVQIVKPKIKIIMYFSLFLDVLF